MEDGGTQQHAPVTDDQELAKVLASMSEEAKKQGPEPTTPSSETVPSPAVAPESPTSSDTSTTDSAAPAVDDQPAADTTAPADITLPELPPVPNEAPSTAAPSDLDEIKKSALSELRPIVDKLDLPAEEKFEALLLVIRSSDDQSLIKAAYAAAEGITDEAKKAQALLDVVKEIEYFSSRSA